MCESEVTLIVSRHEMAVAKKIAFSLGKIILARDEFSASLFRNYIAGERLWHLYARYTGSLDRRMPKN